MLVDLEHSLLAEVVEEEELVEMVSQTHVVVMVVPVSSSSLILHK